MKKLAQFLQLALLLYFLLFLIFFFSFDTLGSAFGMDPLTPESMVKVFLTGLILFLVAWGATLIYQNRMTDQTNKLQAEMNELKAKLYDFEHPKATPLTRVAPPKVQDDTSANLRPRQNFTD